VEYVSGLGLDVYKKIGGIAILFFFTRTQYFLTFSDCWG